MNLYLRSGFLSFKMPFYAVRLGRIPGIYLTWDEARKNVEGFHGAVHKKFSSKSEADAFFQAPGGYSKPATSKPSSQSSVPAQKTGTLNGTFSCSYQEANLSRPSTSTSSVNNPGFGSQSAHTLSNSAIASTKSNSDDMFNLVMYTDGACKGNQDVRNKSCPAGWGAVILTGSHEIVAEIYAPVELYAASPYYLGAEVKSNNTAELSAIGESLIYLRDTAKNFSCSCTSACRCPKATVVIRYDSEYAAKSVMGLFNGEKNKNLYTNIRDIYRSVKYGGTYEDGELSGQRRRPIDVKFEKVKGHSGDTWNDRADHLANEGARGLTCAIGRYKGSSLKRIVDLRDVVDLSDAAEPYQVKKLRT